MRFLRRRLGLGELQAHLRHATARDLVRDQQHGAQPQRVAAPRGPAELAREIIREGGRLILGRNRKAVDLRKRAERRVGKEVLDLLAKAIESKTN